MYFVSSLFLQSPWLKGRFICSLVSFFQGWNRYMLVEYSARFKHLRSWWTNQSIYPSIFPLLFYLFCLFFILFYFFFSRKTWIDQRITRGWSGEMIRISSSLNILVKKHGSDHCAFISKRTEECSVLLRFIFIPFLYSCNPSLSAMRVDYFLTCTKNFFWFITFLKAVADLFL